MASFEGSIGTPSGGFNLMVEYSITQSIDGNYSDVSATGYVKRNKSSYYPYNSQSSSNLTIDGSSAGYNGAYNLGSDGYKAIISHSKRVYHNSDGTKGITISFSFNGLLNNWYPNGNISQYITLPTIPRASDIGCSSPYIGDTATITISKKSSGYTSKVWYVFGNLSNIIANGTYDSVISFNTNSVKEQLYAQIPNSKQGYGTMYCETFNGNTSIGIKSCQFYLYAKESDCKPDVSAIFKDNKASIIEQTGDEKIIVKGQSFAQVNINATAKYSSSIRNYSVICDDGQKDTNQESVIYRPKSSIFKISATDSRGYSTTTEYDLSTINQWLDYIELAYTSDISVKRTEQLSDEVVLNVEGNYYNDILGQVPGFRNIKIGDDLSGKTIYCNFPAYFYNQILHQTETSDDIIIATKKITQDYNSITGETFVKFDTDNLYYSDEYEHESYLATYTLPNDFGIVSFIDSNLGAYEYIKILSDDTPVDNHNNLEMYFQYKLSGSLDWSNKITINPTISNNKFSVNNLVLGNYFDHNQEYVFRVITQDKLMQIGDYSVNEQIVTKGIPVVRIGEEFVQVNGDLLIGESNLVNQYSTSEIKTHKKWIDGKPIYRKVVLINSISGTNVNEIAVPTNIDTMLPNVCGIVYDNSGNGYFINYNNVYNTGQDIGAFYYKTHNCISIKQYAEFNINNGYIIIEYTKTTD